MTELPVALENGLIYFTDDVLAGAGHHVHARLHPVHTHSFIEVMFVIGGEGVHLSQLGRHELAIGDIMVLRPGAWHALEECSDLQVVNCCFGVELLHRELAWTREDSLLSQLLWDGPYAPGQGGVLQLRLDHTDLASCVVHLDALEDLRAVPSGSHRADIVGRLALVLGHLARGVGQDGDSLSTAQEPTHPAVVRAIRLFESRIAHDWSLAELAEQLHLAPNYLGRVFKSATGLPPMAYLAHYRMETAAVLLGRTDQSVAQVSEAVGCADQNYFARRFKAHYGLSPSTYRLRGIRD
ncbi:AraC family transcriptional regulator [Streptacidiphilus sp. PB12-B1b]|uniref:helix-turn-helix transcriptional regulator n=1 Tax=Streptacidiphilus TaxID=228398 RepID=UPI00054B74CB|nr:MULTISPECIES: AraC family transcriptional regulator [Streptacidiphilus]QMU78433.1 AraC family transcriptional regulator [Streptacidiphilus sp. PB12-B1b]